MAIKAVVVKGFYVMVCVMQDDLRDLRFCTGAAEILIFWHIALCHWMTSC